jgi:peptide/nickel transport system permease protein
MAEATLPLESGAEAAEISIRGRFERQAAASTFSRIAKYAIVKIVVLFITVVVGVYLTILVANMGGYVDNIRRGQIQEEVAQVIMNNRDLQQMPLAERNQRIEQMVQIRERQLGLDKPFFVRSLHFLSDALTLNLGRAENMTSDTGSKQVRLIILERLPSTLLLFATANLLNFFLSILAALYLSRRYGSVADRLVIALAPMSAAPAWFYGLFLILLFASVLGILPFGGMVDPLPPASPVAYAVNLLKHMILPVAAITLSAFFLNVYGWRTFFLIYSSEDYVEMAKAQGLTSRTIERRYILRPTLPTIITNFALTLITLWTGAIILETVFNWPGLGRLFFRAIGSYDTPVIVGSTVIYAYLLAITVFLLDFVYALVDPRVKIGDEGRKT